eukprot:9344298-Prorocentrum_lima.AAC.1
MTSSLVGSEMCIRDRRKNNNKLRWDSAYSGLGRLRPKGSVNDPVLQRQWHHDCVKRAIDQ